MSDTRILHLRDFLERECVIELGKHGDVNTPRTFELLAAHNALDMIEGEMKRLSDKIESLQIGYDQRGSTIDAMEESIEEMHAAITELQAAQAGEWRPLGDGFFQSSVTTGLYAVSVEGDSLRLHMRRMGEWTDLGMVVLPDYIRLCARTTIGSQEGRNE